MQPIASKSDAIQLRLPERNKGIETTIEDLKNQLSKKTNISQTTEELSAVKERIAPVSTPPVNGRLHGQAENNQSQHGAQGGSNGLHPFQVDFIRNIIDDAMEDSRLVFRSLFFKP